jgi:hypothetical protein
MSAFHALDRRIPGATVPLSVRNAEFIDREPVDINVLRVVAAGLRRWNPEQSPIRHATAVVCWTGPAAGRANGGGGHRPRHARGTIYDTRAGSR